MHSLLVSYTAANNKNKNMKKKIHTLFSQKKPIQITNLDLISMEASVQCQVEHVNKVSWQSVRRKYYVNMEYSSYFNGVHVNYFDNID